MLLHVVYFPLFFIDKSQQWVEPSVEALLNCLHCLQPSAVTVYLQQDDLTFNKKQEVGDVFSTVNESFGSEYLGGNEGVFGIWSKYIYVYLGVWANKGTVTTSTQIIQRK